MMPYYSCLLVTVWTLYQLLADFDPAKLPPGVHPEDTFIYHIRLEDITPAEIVEKRKEALLARNEGVTDSLENYRQKWLSKKSFKGLQKMESGLEYIIHKQGDGEAIKDGQYLEAHYVGMLKEGKVFDSSFKKFQPFVFSIGRKNVITGWDEAIPLLNVGGSMTLLVPSYMAYGVKGSPPDIPPNADLIFYIEIVGKRFELLSERFAFPLIFHSSTPFLHSPSSKPGKVGPCYAWLNEYLLKFAPLYLQPIKEQELIMKVQ